MKNKNLFLIKRKYTTPRFVLALILFYYFIYSQDDMLWLTILTGIIIIIIFLYHFFTPFFKITDKGKMTLYGKTPLHYRSVLISNIKSISLCWPKVGGVPIGKYMLKTQINMDIDMNFYIPVSDKKELEEFNKKFEEIFGSKYKYDIKDES